MTREEALEYIDRNLDLLARWHTEDRSQIDREIHGARWKELTRCKEIINESFDDFELWEHDLRVTIEHYQEQASIYKGALDRANDDRVNLNHSIESKNARIKELEAHNKELSKDFTHAKYVDLYAEPKTCETCKTHNYANSECDLLRYLPEFYRKEFGCIHHAPIDKG